MRKAGPDNNIDDGKQEKLITVNRTSKTLRGGRKMGFAALVVAGGDDGTVGYGYKSAAEVPVAIQKATEHARRSMVRIPLKNKTLHHPIRARHGASKVIMMPADEGTGIIAGNAMRAIFEVMGIENILAKCIGSSNPVNVVKATIKGLTSMLTAESVAAKRGLPYEEEA